MDLTTAKEDYDKLLNSRGGVNVNDGDVKRVVIELFNELQDNHIKLGVDANGVGNFRIYTPGFLNRLIMFFPFLNDVKRY